jgi:hypothetical protein
MTFWDISYEDIFEHLIYGNVSAKALIRILFIIEARLARFERFKAVIENPNETPEHVIFMRAKARQAVAWYQFLWYGITEKVWQYGFDRHDKDLRDRYLKKKAEKAQLRAQKKGEQSI